MSFVELALAKAWLQVDNGSFWHKGRYEVVFQPSSVDWRNEGFFSMQFQERLYMSETCVLACVGVQSFVSQASRSLYPCFFFVFVVFSESGDRQINLTVDVSSCTFLIHSSINMMTSQRNAGPPLRLKGVDKRGKFHRNLMMKNTKTLEDDWRTVDHKCGMRTFRIRIRRKTLKCACFERK